MTQRVSCPFEQRPSPLFGSVYRPTVLVSLWSRKITDWVEVVVLVDTGADYTLLPQIYAKALGIDLRHAGRVFATQDVGGSEQVSLVKRWQLKLPSSDRYKQLWNLLIGRICGRDRGLRNTRRTLQGPGTPRFNASLS